MACWDVTTDDRNGHLQEDLNSACVTRIMHCDNYRNWREEAPQIGDTHPYWPEFTCTAREGRPLNFREHEDGYVDYDRVEICLTYSNMALGADGETLISFNIGCKIIQLTKGMAYADTSPVEDTVNLRVTVGTMSIKRLVSTVNWATDVDPYVDCVNSSSWTPAGSTRSFSAGTLKYLGCAEERVTNNQNGYLSYLVHRFEYHAHGHNTWFDVASGTWKLLDPTIYAEADFRRLTGL